MNGDAPRRTKQMLPCSACLCIDRTVKLRNSTKRDVDSLAEYYWTDSMAGLLIGSPWIHIRCWWWCNSTEHNIFTVRKRKRASVRCIGTMFHNDIITIIISECRMQSCVDCVQPPMDRFKFCALYFFYTIPSIPEFALLFWLAFIQCTIRGTMILFELYYYLAIIWGEKLR